LSHRLFCAEPEPLEQGRQRFTSGFQHLHPVLKLADFCTNKVNGVSVSFQHSCGRQCRASVARLGVALEKASSPSSTTFHLQLLDGIKATTITNPNGVTVLDIINEAVKQWNSPCEPEDRWDGIFENHGDMCWDDKYYDEFTGIPRREATHWNVTQKTSCYGMTWCRWTGFCWKNDGVYLGGPNPFEMSDVGSAFPRRYRQA